MSLKLSKKICIPEVTKKLYSYVHNFIFPNKQQIYRISIYQCFNLYNVQDWLVGWLVV